MQFDLQSAQIAVGIVASILVILGNIFGWFGKVWRWAASFFKPKPLVGLIDVPARRMVLIPASRSNALWWHMGSVGSEPAMQIVGDLNVTNISKYGIFVMGAKLRKPKAVGHALVRAQNSNLYDSKDMIPEGAVSELQFDFFVQPPVRKPGETFKADLAIIDQFGSEQGLYLSPRISRHQRWRRS